jgi:hypothetical protein
MEKNKKNWWIDAAFLFLFWIAFFPELTGLAFHEWLGVAAVGLALIHLILHWSWVETVTLRFFSSASSRPRIYYLLDLGVLLGFVMILLTGLLISTWLDLPLYDLAAWTRVHLLTSVFTLLTVALKLVIHWRWIASCARRYVFDPVRAGFASSAPPRRPSPLGRRDFLKVTGILGAATALTVHGLFDSPVEAQAQSISAEPAVPDPPPSSANADSPSASSPPDADPAAETPDGASDPTPTPSPDACTVLCPNGCAYPGRCRRYVDRNGNNWCDNGECL